MRVLWLCNIMPPIVASKLHMESNVKEGWITGLLSQFIEKGKDSGISLGMAFPVNENLKSYHDVYVFNGFPVDCFGFYENTDTPETYQPNMERRLEEIVVQFKPDVVHIFGTEYPHALAMAKAYPHPEKILVGIQGVISLCAKEYLADLPTEVRENKTLRDIIKEDGILEQQKKFEKRGEGEQKLLCAVGNVTGRTAFDREFCKTINEEAEYYPMNETMRPCFYEGGWEIDNCRKHRIFFSQADYPLKGFHYLLQAMPGILERFPDAQIAVAGNDIIHKGGVLGFLKISAYGKYLKKLIKQNGLSGKVQFLGKLSAEEMKEQCLQCHTFVCASSLENSPNSVAEAMLLGTPVVAAEVGGIPSMVTNRKEGLLFKKGDIEGLTKAIIELWEPEKGRFLAKKISVNAVARAKQTHNPETNFKRLLEIYHSIRQKCD